MRTLAVDVTGAQKGVRQSKRPVVFLTALFIAGGLPASGQESRPAPDRLDGSNGTILNPKFAKKLGDAMLDWPTPEAIEAAQAADTEYPRIDACRWQEIVLAKDLRVASYVRGDKGETFTAAASAGGYDSVYYRWETDDYRLQFRCARWLMSVMVEPKRSGARRALSADEVKDRAAHAVGEIVRRGRQLLANSTMQLEPTQYGYLIRFQRTPEQSKALWADETDRFVGPSEEGDVVDLGNDWLTSLKIRTDGYSFVFDFVKLGVGPLRPSMPVTTTQPGDKTWFEERKPAPSPSP